MAKSAILNINDVQPDLNNPRLAEYLIDAEPNPDRGIVFRMLGYGEPEKLQFDRGTSYAVLKRSIQENGGIINPIIVRQDENNKYTVIEGNTRVAIYLQLHKETGEDRWLNIPAQIHDEMSQDDVDKVRLLAHMVGIRQWSPFAKGKYLFELSRPPGNVDSIAKVCGGDKKTVLEYINAYKDMHEHYFPLIKDPELFDPTRFSSFREVQRPKVRESLEAHGFSMSDFAKWLTESPTILLKKNEHVRDLPKILSNKKAREVFLKRGSISALEIVAADKDVDLQKYTIQELANELTIKLRTLRSNDIEYYLDHQDHQDVEGSVTLYRELDDFFENINYHIDL